MYSYSFQNHVLFFWIPALIAQAAAVIPNGANIFFTKGTATFINEPSNLLNSDPKNILLLNVFLSFVFYLDINNN